MGKKGRRTSQKEKAKESQAKSSNSKMVPVIIIVAIIAIGGYLIVNRYSTAIKPGETRVTDKMQDASVDIESLRGGESKPVLSPARFVGKVAKMYKIARENRELMDSMYCYCHCKANIGHKSLLSCFTDMHAANCGICLRQASLAYQLHQKGYEIPQVREAVDKEFWRPLG